MKTLLALAAFLSLSTAALAQDQVRVPYGDLNLATAEGARTFRARIREVALERCRPAGHTASVRCLAAVERTLLAELPAQARADYARVVRVERF